MVAGLTGIVAGCAIVAGIAIAKVDIHLLEKRHEKRMAAFRRDVDAIADEEGAVKIGEFAKVMRKHFG